MTVLKIFKLSTTDFYLTHNWKNKISFQWYIRTFKRGFNLFRQSVGTNWSLIYSGRMLLLHWKRLSLNFLFFRKLRVCESNFLKNKFIWVKPLINSERSRCFLVVSSASVENVLVNNLIIRQWYSVFPTLSPSLRNRSRETWSKGPDHVGSRQTSFL